MAKLYADEQFPKATTATLRVLGHDVLTVQEAGKGNQRVPDDEVLAFATEQDRAVLTLNRADFIQLHKQSSNHAGIIVCTENPDFDRLAIKIDEAIAGLDFLQGQLIRIYRDS
jgi:predicted nuclease of predicted toxin-antitoxin system